MKRCLMCLLLAGTVFSLAAQANQSVSVYLPLVTGTGIDRQDNSFYYMLIYHELEARNNVRIGSSSYSTDYSLVGTLSPMGATGSSSAVEYRFDLYLQDNKTGQFISEQRYRYSRLE